MDGSNGRIRDQVYWTLYSKSGDTYDNNGALFGKIGPNPNNSIGTVLASDERKLPSQKTDGIKYGIG